MGFYTWCHCATTKHQGHQNFPKIHQSAFHHPTLITWYGSEASTQGIHSPVDPKHWWLGLFETETTTLKHLCNWFAQIIPSSCHCFRSWHSSAVFISVETNLRCKFINLCELNIGLKILDVNNVVKCIQLSTATSRNSEREASPMLAGGVSSSMKFHK